MRERYETPACLITKTCLVRNMCRPTAAYEDACVRLRAHVVSDRDLSARLEEALGRPTLQTRHQDVRELIRTLPPRIPANVASLRVTRQESFAVKRHARARTVLKNRRQVIIDGRALLKAARGILIDREARLLELALALMLLTGRRTCETLNGRSTFSLAGPFALHFTGQAKRRGADDRDGMLIPTLAPAHQVVQGFARLRELQSSVTLTNLATSRRYQTGLHNLLREGEVWCPRVHALRGLYARMAIGLFDWNGATDAYVAMCILGHSGLNESLAYTPFSLGHAFAQEPHLGLGALSDAT